MKWLSDETLAHLRDIAETPDLRGTRYTLVRELGRGGMGVVYEVHDQELDRSVAMKVVDDPTRGEARIIAALEHPGIVPVHDVGLLEDGRFYYTMKLVRGVRLDEWVRQEHGRTEALRLFARICEPVAFAHANGVVHRDLKPENVMVGEFGAVLVMDWGVAHADGGAHERVIVGTPGYMAPEQARGERADARSDVYALGAMLAFLAGDDAPRPLKAIVARATAADASERYADARELADDVVRFLDAEPVSAYRESVFERAGRWIVKYRALLTLLAAYLVMRAAVLFWTGH
ncbi:MAG TPA: serine/threonine-protein kinase [Thermoanaerobaculia bacterium]